MTPAEKTFSDIMNGLLPGPVSAVAVAVSGGGDSLALTLMLKKWTEARGAGLLALTVDHGLRPESKSEAQKLGGLLAARGIRHKILSWTEVKPKTHVQELARQARYRLLAEACRAENISTLALGHNIGDQAETFWMRLAHGSGLDGLAGMAAARDVHGIRIIRPVLSFEGGALRDFCRAEGADFCDDPSNMDEKYLRVRLRAFESMLAAEGFSPQRLAQTMRKLQEARAALESMTVVAAEKCLVLHEAGYAVLDKAGWSAYPADIRRRLILQAIAHVAPQEYAPGFPALENLNIDEEEFSGRTLAGCDIFPGRENEIIFCRELAAAAPRGSLAEGAVIWDNRFFVDAGAADGFEVGALGERQAAALRRKIAEQKSVLALFESLPAKVRYTLLAVYKGENLVAVPHLSWFDAASPENLQDIKIMRKIV